MIATIHVAGEVQLGGLYQECSRCGFVLQDYAGRQVATVVEPGQPAPTLPAWPVGKRIGMAGPATWVLSDDAVLESDERECRATS